MRMRFLKQMQFQMLNFVNMNVAYEFMTFIIYLVLTNQLVFQFHDYKKIYYKEK